MKKSNTVDSKTKLNNDVINQEDDQEFYFALDKESAQSENTLNNSINDVFLDALDEEVDTISLAESYEKLKIEALNNFYNKELKELRAQPRKENDAEINEKANFENSIFSHLADQWLQESNKNNIQWITDSFYSKFTEYSISGPLKTFAYVGGGAAIGLIGGYGVGMLCGSSTAMTTISSLSFATASGTVSGTVGAVLDKDIKSTLDPVIKDIGIENVITNLSQESNPGEVMLDIAKTIVYDTVLGSTAGSINSGSQVGIIAGGGVAFLNSVNTQIKRLNNGEGILSPNMALTGQFIHDNNIATAVGAATLQGPTLSRAMGVIAATNNLISEEGGLSTLLKSYNIPERKFAAGLIVFSGFILSAFVVGFVGLVPGICLASGSMLVATGCNRGWDKKIIDRFRVIKKYFGKKLKSKRGDFKTKIHEQDAPSKDEKLSIKSEIQVQAEQIGLKDEVAIAIVKQIAPKQWITQESDISLKDKAKQIGEETIVISHSNIANSSQSNPIKSEAKKKIVSLE